MEWEHVDLNELSNNAERLHTCSSSNKKVNTVVQLVDLLVDLRLDLLLFVDVHLLLCDVSVDCVCETGTGVWVETETGIVVGVRVGVWDRCNAKIVAVIIFDVTRIKKIV
jgi:hypothetical protein